MSLGQRIAAYRKNLGISQEELGGRLGVSRQAVSKWETDAAVPDMMNLIALAKAFSISLAELTETAEPSVPVPEGSRRNRNGLWVTLLCLLFIIPAGLLIWSYRDAHVGQVDTEPPSSTPAPATDFALLWTNGDGNGEFLELGPQEALFPFGASLELTAPEEVLASDFRSLTGHRADCGALYVEYNHIEPDPELEPEGTAQEILTALSTIVSGYATPRGIGPGSGEADLLMAYGDGLVYCLKEESGYSLVPHEYFYAWSKFTDNGCCTILFYMEQGQVRGIRTELLGELGDWYAPDNVYRFPMKNGEPDFSLREEPEREDLSDTRKVYTAFNQLVTNDNLTAEERYAYRRDVFSLLQDLDWSELGQMGAAESPDDTIFALLNWLEGQDAYTASEILWIQMGCTAKGIDGAYADAYSGLLSWVFFYDPVAFAKNLAIGYLSEEQISCVLHQTAYDAEWHETDLQVALETLDSALQTGQFTNEEAGWARLLRLYLATPLEERYKLPKTPEGL